MIIDATDTILGRLATYAAKQALLGHEITIINAEKAVVSGARQEIFEHYRTKFARGAPLMGPYVSRLPDRLVRRTIRGMIPYKTPRGLAAYKRVMCYTGVPEAFKDQEKVVLKESLRTKLPGTKFVTVKQISVNIGGPQ